MKLGQILSVREDLLGVVWANELAKLQDGVRAFDGGVAVEIARGAFPMELEGLDSDPVAAASLAQVHRAKWRHTDDDGSVRVMEVAVKVLRPGIQDQISTDLCVLLRAGDLLAEWAPRILPTSNIDWRSLLDGLAGGLWEECDLVGEAERQTKFASNMNAVPGVFVPAVVASTKNVMVSEWVDGLPLNSLPTLDPRLVKAQALMRDAYCQSMFVDAFFHADCHGGNLLWVPSHSAVDKDHSSNGSSSSDTPINNNSSNNISGRLCILDCGLMVSINPVSAEALLRLTLHLAARDWTRVVETAIDLRFLPTNLTESNTIQARRVARNIIGPYLDVGGGVQGASSAYSISSLVSDISTAAFDLPISLPADMVLLGRAVVQLEGIAIRTNANYRLVDDVLPTATRIALRTVPASERGMDDVAGLRKSLLFDLLYDDNINDDTRTSAENVRSSSSFALDKLRLLLDTASSASSTSVNDQQQRSFRRTTEDLIDELLKATAIRDVVAKETGNIIDAMARDALWKGADSLVEVAVVMPIIPTFFPKPPTSITRLLESLAPRISRDERILLLRLPEILQGFTVMEQQQQSSDSAGASLSGTTGNSSSSRQRGGFLQDTTIVKISSVPGFSKGLKAILEQTLISKDPNARATVDAIKKDLQDKLQMRLEGNGLPSNLARRLADTTFPTPW